MIEEKYKEFIMELTEELLSNIKFKTSAFINGTHLYYQTFARGLYGDRTINIQLIYSNDSFKINDILFELNDEPDCTDKVDEEFIELGKNYIKEHIEKVIEDKDLYKYVKVAWASTFYGLLKENPDKYGYKELQYLTEEDKLAFNNYCPAGGFNCIESDKININPVTPFIDMTTDKKYLVVVKTNQELRLPGFKGFVDHNWTAYNPSLYQICVDSNDKNVIYTNCNIPITIYKRIYKDNDSNNNNPFVPSNSF